MKRMFRTIAGEIRKGIRLQGAELAEEDVGILLGFIDGYGPVQVNDVGKRIWLKSYGIVMENSEQRDHRKAKNLTNQVGSGKMIVRKGGVR